MEIIEHCRSSMQRFGETGLEVHVWLDQFWNGIENDHSHRTHFHNKLGLKKCTLKFGEKSRKHFFLHMDDDGVELW